MRVTIKLFASFRLIWLKETFIDCEDGLAVNDIVEDIKIPFKDIGIVLVNGRHASFQDILKDGDVLSLMPLIGGG